MTPRPSSKKSKVGTLGAKALISASALAATFGGWASLALAERRPIALVASTATPTWVASQPTAVPTYLAVSLANLPTVMPAPTLPKPAATVNAPPQIIYITQASAAPVAPAPSLRVVNAPPPPPAAPPQQAQSSSNNNSDQQSAAPANNPPPVTTTKSSQP